MSKLDRYVYNRDGSARGAVVSMTRGAFRFATGQSDPKAFKLQTPQAIIGIRGTVLDIDIERGVTHVTLQQGVIDVCPRSSRRNCAVLTQPGQTVSVTSTRVIGDDQIPGAIPPSGPAPIPPDIFIAGAEGHFLAYRRAASTQAGGRIFRQEAEEDLAVARAGVADTQVA